MSNFSNNVSHTVFQHTLQCLCHKTSCPQNLNVWCSWGFIRMNKHGKYHYLTYPHKAKRGVKSCPVHAIREQMMSKGIAPLSLNLNARWRKVVNITLWSLHPAWWEPSYPVKWRWDHTCFQAVLVDETVSSDQDSNSGWSVHCLVKIFPPTPTHRKQKFTPKT
jgi:hypothetical protein